VLASNTRDRLVWLATFGALTSAFATYRLSNRLTACGGIRAVERFVEMSSFHKSVHESASDLVHGGDAERYRQVKRGAPGRIRICAPASGDR
jgi:hypothetical protein